MPLLSRIALLLLVCLPVWSFAKPLQIFVSVPPLKTFVEKIGGQHVATQSLVGPGYSPATYEVTPQQISALAQADLYVRTGVPFEHIWMARIQAANPGMPILDLRTRLPLRNLEAHADAHHNTHSQHEEKDPHVWTAPPLVKQIAHTLRDQLSTLDPTHASDYAQNHTAFIQELDALDQSIRQHLHGLAQTQFLVFHPSWGYFADAYGLQQIAIEHEGKQRGARALAHLIEKARRHQTKVVFVQPQFDQRQAQQIARAINGHVISIDPLATNYIENLYQVSQQLAQALK